MSVPAIVIGEPQTLLRLAPAGIQDPSRWTQIDSDVIAHFLQVQAQIPRSRWQKSDVSFKFQGAKVLESKFPAFEDFVFVAVYFRQLIMKKDDLLNDAANRYRDFVDCRIRAAWIQEEQRRFVSLLDGNAFMLEAYTVRDLFDTFMYGASLMHKTPHLQSAHRARFLEVFDNQPREKVLYALNGSLRLLLNHVSNVAVVLYREFGHWLKEYSLPLPDVRWHDRLFDVDG